MTEPVCPTCREEAEMRALSRELERLPVGLLVEARRASVYTQAYRFRRASTDELAREADALHRDIDGLVLEAQRSGALERISAMRAAAQAARERQAEDDEAGLAARVALEGVWTCG